MEHLVEILVPIACGCVLPIVIVWLAIRKEMNDTNTRTQIVLAAIEKNPDLNIEDLMKKISPKKSLLKEKLLKKLLWGCITALLGVGFIGYCTYHGLVGGGSTSDLTRFSLAGVVLLGIGIALLINYNVGKKVLAKEMEAEKAEMLEQAKP